MKNIILSIPLIFFFLSGFSQTKKEKDVEAIKSMCGCYEVKFNFAEVYSPDLGYELKKPYQSQATEWIALVDEGENFVSMQHILQVSEEMIIKHWRQDWNFEDSKLTQYNVASSWKSKTVSDVEGTWTQSVYQVDDSPRYEGIGTWKHEEETSYWEGSSDSPLPRRDLTKRDDYNVMNRRNRHVIHAEGHTHEEDNTKIDRSAKYGDEVIAIEKGYNTYTKVDDSRCKAAKEWWEKNNKFWELVRAEWDTFLETHSEFALNFEEGKNAEFYMAMFGLGEEMVSEKKFKKRKAKKAIQELIQEFTLEDNSQAANE